jgi:NAD(P)H-hydrate repair Nnr-like enzyme with NAD(P)H-hydrate epimerase domain
LTLFIVDPARFKSKNGKEFAGFSVEAIADLQKNLYDLGISPLQVAEAASYSMAMVVRYALGLSATGGRVCALVGDSIAGAVALATLRHLVNAGAEGLILTVSKEAKLLVPQLAPLSKMGVPLEVLSAATSLGEIAASCHNVIFGLFGTTGADSLLQEIVSVLNEQQTPIHTIEAPLGLDLQTGAVSRQALFASSTLSLGAPYSALNPGQECVGRHYLCDISFTQAMYQKYGDDLSPLFAEQPVTQIFPI